MFCIRNSVLVSVVLRTAMYLNSVCQSGLYGPVPMLALNVLFHLFTFCVRILELVL